MRISELADAAQVPVDTIRYYEKQGLLDGEHFGRQRNGYRAYRVEAVARLELIRQAKAAGFTLAEIRAVIAAWEDDTLTAAHRRDLLSRKIAEIEQRRGELAAVQAYLELKLRQTI